jgi:transcriptional regulator with XRE-family HTH domain
MNRWATYPDFAHFFDDLLKASWRTSEDFARLYSLATGEYISSNLVRSIRNGHVQPTYRFIAGLADHALPLLDPGRVQPEGEECPAGDHRLALFATAGFIEVTPRSVARWNEEVLAGWQRRAATANAAAPTWQELMLKLVSFHTQGGRLGLEELADRIRGDEREGATPDRSRLYLLLYSPSAPTEAERRQLARAVGLDPAQVERVEAAVAAGNLTIRRRRITTSYSSELHGILERLADAGITQRELVARTGPPDGLPQRLGATTLSAWKHGVVTPSVSRLRALVRGLERCGDVITGDDIDRLVAAAASSRAELDATTHELIAGINHKTRLKPLLSALRNAADLDVPVSAVAGTDPATAQRAYKSQVESWENDAQPAYPTGPQLLDLLARYNRLLAELDRPLLTAAEIERVAEVGRRDREAALAEGLKTRARKDRPTSRRLPPTPDFGDGPAR